MRHFFVLLWLVTFSACLPTPRPPVTQPTQPDRTAFFEQSCRDIWQQELHRDIDPGGLASCVLEFKAGASGERIRASVQASAEWAEVHRPRPVTHNLCGQLQVEGRFFRCDTGPFYWRMVTAFRLVEYVAHGNMEAAREFLAWARDTGFNGVRVLTMCGKSSAGTMFDLSPADGETALMPLLMLAKEYDLYVHVVAFANTKAQAVNYEGHMDAIKAACSLTKNCVIEVANEPYHGSQSDKIHSVVELQKLAARVQGIPVALGASSNDESDEFAGGTFVTNHLSRSRDEWNMVRRVREQEALSSKTKKPVVSGEPIGFGEPGTPSRIQNASIAMAFGALGRGFNVGTTFHCEDCIYARVPKPTQQTAAKAFIAGTALWPTAWRFEFHNTGWPSSPIKSAAFVDNALVRAYSFKHDADWWTVLLGLRADPRVQFQNGFTKKEVVTSLPSIEVWSLGK